MLHETVLADLVPLNCLVRLALHHVYKELNVEEPDGNHTHPDTCLASVLLGEYLTSLLLVVLDDDINRLLLQIVQLVDLIAEHKELQDDVTHENQFAQNTEEL